MRRQFDAARDLVDIRMVRTATPKREGEAVVLRSLKNAVPSGRRLRIGTLPTEACGYGDAPRGSRHLIYVTRASATHFAPLDRDLRAALTRIGVLPPDWR